MRISDWSSDVCSSDLDLDVERLLLVAQGPALGHEVLGTRGVALAPQPTDVLRERLDASPQLVALGPEVAGPGVELDDAVDAGCGVAAPAGQPGANGVGVGPAPADVEHGPTGVVPAPRPPPPSGPRSPPPPPVPPPPAATLPRTPTTKP